MKFIPKTNLGRWSVVLILGFFVFLGLFFVFVNVGERGGDTFFSNLKLTIPMLVAAVCGTLSFVLGAVAVFRDKERSVFVFLSILIGMFVLLFWLGEILFPH